MLQTAQAPGKALLNFPILNDAELVASSMKLLKISSDLMPQLGQFAFPGIGTKSALQYLHLYSTKEWIVILINITLKINL